MSDANKDPVAEFLAKGGEIKKNAHGETCNVEATSKKWNRKHYPTSKKPDGTAEK